jgi:hypothetical protein
MNLALRFRNTRTYRICQLSELRITVFDCLAQRAVCELSSAAAFDGQQYVAVLVHGTPVLIDLAILERHELVRDRTTEFH